MKFKQSALWVVVSMLTIAMVKMSYKIAWSHSHRDKDYSYDQVGDGHFCFETEKKCKDEQIHDEIAESSCYN